MNIKIVGNKLHIETELSAGTLSGSGKNLVVATTNGFVQVDGSNVKVSLNVIKPR